MTRTWVLLRGLIREQRHWQDFRQRMQTTFPQDQVLSVDFPGNGECYQQRSPASIEAMVVALRQQLAEHCSGPVHVVALSLGAMATLHWLTDYPGEVSRAVLINSSVSRFSPFWRRLRPANYGRILFRGLLAGNALIRERNILAMTSNLLTAEQREQVAQTWAAYAAERPVSRANALRQLCAAARFQAPIRLPGAVPVLLLNSAGDRLVDPQCSLAMARGWGLPIRVHPQAGHDLTLDDPDWALAAISDWLAPVARQETSE